MLFINLFIQVIKVGVLACVAGMAGKMVKSLTDDLWTQIVATFL